MSVSERLSKMTTSAKNAYLVAASEERQARVSTMFLQGYSFRSIAREIGVGDKTIARDMMRAREAWKKEAGKTYGDHLPEKLAQIDAIRAAAWEGWKRSLRPESIINQETNETKDGEFEKRGRRRKTTAGDPRFLQRLESLLKLECQIIGLLDQDTTQVTNVQINAVEVVINNAEEKEQFDRIYSLEEFQRQQNLT